ncbi:hypothetical protein EDD80_101107 [Anseongella ginsenosidimutans]|uniref:Uncharacterized protein n=1 Tax=Anseongella ginsenosidimutans TaxID=496056 RepID=A0A4R3KZ69_9SPHI|nr:hypothetical protein [Anseongella ginsenosidimutans]QEC51386.1 hypothetical protein FRZ59_02825 [Anseongella ginsenosidimutans]TCS89910.1 hypothetical protein EDD80_101107 [Anseongella ginsenosidimutans]
MKEEDVYSELSAIRNLMERSAKFISLSGLSGILAGTYALAGGWLAYRLVYRESGGIQVREYYLSDPLLWKQLALIAAGVLALSLATGVWLSVRKARKQQEDCWNAGSKRLLASLTVPLLSGGLFILIMLLRGQYGIIVPACLLFYGLALVSGSQYTFSDVKWLGFCEIFLGLLAALVPGYGLIFWITGFGLLHIIYGIVMHFKYDR